MSALTDLLRERRDEWLNLILQRVGRSGFLGSVTSARMDWAEVMRGVEGVLSDLDRDDTEAAPAPSDPPAAGEPQANPSAALGIRMARQMRPRGIPLRVLVGITMVWREASVDLVRAHPETGIDVARAQALMYASTDRMLHALCQEWTEGEGAGDALRELAQAARVQTEEKTRYVGILESLGTPVLLLGTDGRLEYCNPAAWWTFGQATDRGTLRGRPIEEIAPEVAVALAAFRQSGSDEATLERRVMSRQGLRYMDMRLSRVRDVRREVVGTVVVLNDVTRRSEVEDALRQSQARLEERVQERTVALERANAALRGEVRERAVAEQVLRESEARYRTLVNLSPDGIIVHHNGRVVFANAAARTIMGLAMDDDSLLEQQILEFVHPEDRAVVADRIRAMLVQSATAPPLEERFLRADGTAIDVEVSAAGIQWEGQPSIQVVFRDVSGRLRERREAEERARSMELLVDALERVSRAEPGTEGDGVAEALAAASGAHRSVWFAVDPAEGSLRFASGYRIEAFREAVTQAREFRFLPGRDDDLMAQVAVGREPLYLPDCRTDPRWRRLEAETSSALFLPVRFRNRLFGVALLMSSNRDGFPVPRRERAVLAADYLGAALENAHLHARTREAEQRFRSIFENAMEGLYQCARDGRLIAANPALARMLGCDDPGELLASPEDFPVRLHTDPDRRATFLGELSSAGFVRGFEYEVVRPDGERVWVSESARAQRAPDGTIEMWEGVVEDVTLRKVLQQQLQQSQKMEAVGRLAGGVAHDFNNLLTAILGYSGMVMDQLQPNDPCRQDVAEIREAGKRAASLTRQLLAFSRKQVLQPIVLDLNAAVTGIDAMLRRLIGEDIELVTRPASKPVHVQADPGQLDQVLVNLAVNSRDAMPQGGRLTIDVETFDLDGTAPIGPAGLGPGPYALVTVSDTGTGMDDSVRSHLFEPFFTTKGPGKGTGLGLAVVYGIVKQSGGHIWCESAPGQGTCMRVCLPRVRDADTSGLRHDAGPRVPRGSETVLVAEDESAVRGLVRVVLETAGYRVLEARDGRHALEVVAHMEGALHLLVTDVVMPGMNGRELACTIQRAIPNLRVLFTSGYTDSVIEDAGNLGPGTAFLQKPFSPDSLLQVVRELLDQPMKSEEAEA